MHSTTTKKLRRNKTCRVSEEGRQRIYKLGGKAERDGGHVSLALYENIYVFYISHADYISVETWMSIVGKHQQCNIRLQADYVVLDLSYTGLLG